MAKNFRKQLSTNESMVSSQTKRPKNKPTKTNRSVNRSVNKSLQRYICSTEARINKSKNFMSGPDSRNTSIYKSKSISQNDKVLKFDSKTPQMAYGSGTKYSKIGGTMKPSNDPFNRTQQISLNGSDYKDKELKRIPSQNHNIDMGKNGEYYANKGHRKKSSISVSSNNVYRHQDSRHFSHQTKPLHISGGNMKPTYLANMLGNNPGGQFDDSYIKNHEENKSVDRNNDNFDMVKSKVTRSPSENNDKMLNNLFANAPHCGERGNEERLNFLSDANLSKIDNMSIGRRAEKSVDLTMRSGGLLDHPSEMITSKVISNNTLSKYLTKFIGNRDYRTTEERELAKCTFRPRFVNKHKFKRVKGKVAGYIKEEGSHSRVRDIALFAASENIKSVVSSQSIMRGHSMDSRMNQSL